MSEIFLESSLVDKNDDEILSLVAFLHEDIKQLEEKKKNDLELKRLQRAVKEYADQHYNSKIKLNKLKLKAARRQAKVRQLQFSIEEGLI